MNQNTFESKVAKIIIMMLLKKYNKETILTELKQIKSKINKKVTENDVVIATTFGKYQETKTTKTLCITSITMLITILLLVAANILMKTWTIGAKIMKRELKVMYKRNKYRENTRTNK